MDAPSRHAKESPVQITTRAFVLVANDVWQASPSAGLLGAMVENKRVILDRVEAGSRAWLDAPLALFKPGQGTPTIGQAALFAAPLGLDIIDDWIGFQPDAQGNLPLRRGPPPIGWLNWHRSAEGQRLRVGAVPAESGVGRAGFRPGDQVLAVGDLRAAALTIRRIQEAVGAGKPLRWELLRDGQVQRIDYPASPGAR
jgi:hypothetical protein